MFVVVIPQLWGWGGATFIHVAFDGISQPLYLCFCLFCPFSLALIVLVMFLTDTHIGPYLLVEKLYICFEVDYFPVLKHALFTPVGYLWSIFFHYSPSR
jgi:hypothetical protein